MGNFSKTKRINRLIAKGVELKKLVNSPAHKAIERKVRKLDLLNKIAFDTTGKYGSEVKQRARQELRRMASYSYATTDTVNTVRINKDSWRPNGTASKQATGKQKVKLGPRSPKI